MGRKVTGLKVIIQAGWIAVAVTLRGGIMINKLLISLYLALFVLVPYKIDVSGIWKSYNDPDQVNEVALAIYLLYESVVHAII